VCPDREHPRLEHVAARPLEQARVLPVAQDVLVDGARALLLDDVGLDQFVADPHAETADRGVAGQREEELSLESAVGRVDERLLDRGAGDLVVDLDGHLVVADVQRHVAAVDLGDQRTHPLVGRGGAVAEQPGRRLLQLGALLAVAAQHERLVDRALEAGAAQLHRLHAALHLDFTLVEPERRARRQLDQAAGAEDEAAAAHQLHFHRVGAPRFGPHLVARLKARPVVERRPSLAADGSHQRRALPVEHHSHRAVLRELRARWLLRVLGREEQREANEQRRNHQTHRRTSLREMAAQGRAQTDLVPYRRAAAGRCRR